MSLLCGETCIRSVSQTSSTGQGTEPNWDFRIYDLICSPKTVDFKTTNASTILNSIFPRLPAEWLSQLERKRMSCGGVGAMNCYHSSNRGPPLSDFLALQVMQDTGNVWTSRHLWPLIMDESIRDRRRQLRRRCFSLSSQWLHCFLTITRLTL